MLPRPLALAKELYVFGRLKASLCVNWIADDGEGNEDEPDGFDDEEEEAEKEGGESDEDDYGAPKKKGTPTDIGFDRRLASGEVILSLFFFCFLKRA